MKRRRLAAIMFTDIAGYTAIMQRSEKEGLGLRDRHREIFQKLTEKFNGRILQYYGDGTLSIFDSAVDAVNCGIEMQGDFQTDPEVPVRIGVHLGDIIVTEEEIIGDGVNIASRIESLAVPGSVFISDKIFNEVKNNEGIETQFLKKFKLKNVVDPVGVYAISNPGMVVPNAEEISRKLDQLGSFKKTPRKLLFSTLILILLIAFIGFWGGSKWSENFENRQDIKIAVLPFVDYSQEGDQEWFCDGLTEQITSNLVRIPTLKVIARTSAMKFKGAKKTASEIGKELNVTHILEGSVRKSEEKIRITTQLIKVKDEFHLWEKDFDKKPSDFFEIQDEVSTAIADALSVRISNGKDQGNPIKFDNHTKNMEALRNYQLARNYYDLYDSWAILEYQTGLDYFDAALEADSTFAEAYIGKANLLLAVAWRNMAGAEIKPIIQECIEKALFYDPSLGNAFAARGYYYYIFDFDFARAEENFKKAIDLNPNCDVCYAKYFQLKFVLGKYEEARILIDKAIALNPLNTGYLSMKAETFWSQNKLDTALLLFEQNLKSFPDDRYNVWSMACTYGFSGQYDKAIEMINGIYGYKDNNFAAAFFATMKGDTSYARVILENRLQYYNQNMIAWTWDIAVIYGILGEHDTAIDWLEKGPWDFMYIAHWFMPLRSHPRFQKLLSKYGFDPSTYPNETLNFIDN